MKMLNNYLDIPGKHITYSNGLSGVNHLGSHRAGYYLQPEGILLGISFAEAVKSIDA